MRLISRILTLAVMVGAMAVLHGDILAQQQQSCDSIVEKLDDAIKICELINEGWACYGNEEARAAPPEVRFYKPGDNRPLEELTSIETISDVGVALMYFWTIGEADPVTVILYGGADLSPDDHGFALTMGADGELCEASPPGMVAYTESRQPGIITVNGVQIKLKSAALVAMTSPDTMVIANIEGSVAAEASGQPQPIDPGWQVQVGGIGDDQPVFTGEPQPSPYALSAVAKFLASALGQVYDPNTDEDSQIPACGGEISIGQSIRGEIHAPGQECLYTFCPNPEEVVTVKVDAVGQALDPYIDLRAANLGFVVANNDRSGDTKNSLICNQPVAAADCDQTIVVRANRNQTAGSFLLALDGKTDCTNPPCFCKITAKPGLNLRTGPGTQYSLVRPALWPGFIVEPLACTVDQQWYYVSATELGVTGWIRADPDYVECEPCISCNILSPGIDVSVIPEPAGPVTRGSTVVFHVSVRNTGKTPLDRLSLNNAFTGTDSAYLPTGEACSELNDQSLAVGAEKTCDIAISNVAGGFVSANATASAIGPYDATVADSGSATVEIVAEPCATPEIELRAEPGVYTIQDECGSADFNLSVVNKSAEPITITLVTLDGLALRQNTLEGQQCFESQTLTGGQILGGCSLRVPLDGGVCNEDDKIMAWEVSVTAETDRCEATAKTPLRVIFYRTPTPGETPTPRETPTPTPTHCLKCGPYLEQ